MSKMANDGIEGVLLDSMLIDIAAIRNEYDATVKKDSSEFNVFTILRNADDEVGLHSRFIYELLNPKAAHRQKGLFLYEFLKTIEHRLQTSLSETISVELLEYALVYREKDNIDLLILLPEGSTIIIENKIYAGDQPKQLERYYQTVVRKHRRKTDQVYVCYLTLDGHDPADSSVGELTAPVYTLSYQTEILNWLNSCIFKTFEHQNIQETIIQYRHLIMKLTDTYEGEEKRMMEKVVGMITQSRENFQSALDMSKAVPYAKTQVMKDLFKSFNEAMKFTGFKKMTYDEWYIEEADKYYLTSKRNIPCQAYSLLEFEANGKRFSLDFAININYRLYFSFVFSTIESDIYKIMNVHDAEKRFPEILIFVQEVIRTSFESDSDADYGDEDLYWELLTTEDGREYNFNDFDDACICLLGNSDREAKRMIAEQIDKLNEIREAWGLRSERVQP